MSRHRAERPHRVQARYGRMAAAGLALAVTGIALLGGVGIIPIPSNDDAVASVRVTPDSATQESPAAAGVIDADVGEPATAAERSTPAASGSATPTPSPKATAKAIPAGSGSGRRVVFSQREQRVWLVGANGNVLATYLVSGSVTDNLHPGSYRVYSRSRWAVGIDDSGVMQYFVRFTRGNNAAIGFHSIPTKDGEPLQTVAQLGTPRSHGCIRQKLTDAQRMWEFAPVGTSVVVV